MRWIENLRVAYKLLILCKMENVATASDEQSTAADEIATASKSLAQLAQNLQTSLNKFQF
ncbi:hypothetical protein SELR_14690 [Selenomonas ruminantium subsp. lactilytica TAM6421]|uniref:Methyl-accepting chemotaxis protein n=1 Tax=Selenomonas ruminantium subsp. lactilytica (strain NBRC 103574 / TAM6421) TaxID=927704 RepID=I0GQZ0_SELRL|nr:hypothetical protein [Selenomonas ruminantium]BAL83177.1 hypothetical protein SELR_14690 [Selenomonas ruminantium subsp. lactilytica TAM6421]